MKIPKTLGLSEELWDEIEERRAAMNRSAFVETSLWEVFKAWDELASMELDASSMELDASSGIGRSSLNPKTEELK